MLPYNVRRVKATDNLPIEEGSFFATDGAWDRKYICSEVLARSGNISEDVRFYRYGRAQTFQAVRCVDFIMVYLGRFYATGGRMRTAERNSRRTCRAYYNAAGECIITEKGDAHGHTGRWCKIPQVHVTIK